MTYVTKIVSMIWVTEVMMLNFVNFGPLAVAVSVFVAIFKPTQRVLGAGVLNVLILAVINKTTNNFHGTDIVCTTVWIAK